MNRSSKRKFWIIVPIVTVTILAGVLSIHIDSVNALFDFTHTSVVLSRFFKEIVHPSTAGQYYEGLIMKHGDEVSLLFENYPEHSEKSLAVVQTFIPGLEALMDGEGETVRITEEQIIRLKAELDWMTSVGSVSLRADIEAELQRFPLENFIGMTMNEAHGYVNSNFPPGLKVESTTTPEPLPTGLCVAGYTSDCLAEPLLVPGSDGTWAYYVLSGVYFEYPSAWRIEQNLEISTILALLSTTDSYESGDMDAVYFSVETGPALCDATYDPLTYAQTVLSYTETIWNRPVSLPDFDGNQYLWSENHIGSLVYLESYFCDPDTQMSIGFMMTLNPNPTNTSIYNPDLVQVLYPNYRHIMESARIWKP